jgi:cation transport regulator ChaC
VVKSNEDDVEGILFTISESDEAALDRYECVSYGCYEKAMLKIIHDGAEIEALVYIDPINEEGESGDRYSKIINNAVLDAHLSKEYIAKYIRKFISENNR